jgi:hypothetical protein
VEGLKLNSFKWVNCGKIDNDNSKGMTGDKTYLKPTIKELRWGCNGLADVLAAELEEEYRK